MSEGTLFQTILGKLKGSVCTSKLHFESHRAAIREACSHVDSIISSDAIPIESFVAFLKDSHNLFMDTDSMVRATLLRTIRISVDHSSKFGSASVPTSSSGSSSSNKSRDYRRGVAMVEAIVSEEWHWLISMSLERQPLMEINEDYSGRGGGNAAIPVVVQDYVFERMQALKLVKQIMKTAPDSFPVALGRSLVATAQSETDNTRRVCMETLRILLISNARVAVMSGGLSTLLNAIFEPLFADMVDQLTTAVLFTLNDPRSRRFLRPHLDLRIFFAPFTDLDADEAELLPSWRASKSALVIILRSWVGLSMVTSDELALPTLVKLLVDGKVPPRAQDMVLDILAETFDPVFSRVRRSRLSQHKRQYNRKITVTRREQTTGVGEESPRSPGGASNANGESNAVEDISKQPPKRRSIFANIFGGEKEKESSKPTSTSTRRPSAIRGAFNYITGSGKAKEDNLDSLSSQLPSENNSNVGITTSSVIGEHTLINIMDSYSAALCCALIHAELIESLCHLATHGEPMLAAKASWLLVELLRTVAQVLPEGRCAELLDVPALIEFSSSTRARMMTNRAHKASKLLENIADAFTTAPREFRMGHSLPIQYSGSYIYTNSLKAQGGDKSGMTIFVDSRLGRGRQSSALTAAYGTETRGPGEQLAGNNNYYHQFQRVGILGQGIGEGALSICAITEYITSNNVTHKSAAGGAGHQGEGSSGTSLHSQMESISYMLRLSNDTMGIGSYPISGGLGSKDGGKDANTSGSSAGLNSSSELMRLLEASRVLGKEGKEPFRWNWELIYDLLENCFSERHNPAGGGAGAMASSGANATSNGSSGKSGKTMGASERLQKAMKTKWVQRVSGFYRCNEDKVEKGFFAKQTWEPSNLNFLGFACKMYEVLVNVPEGRDFLLTDRRGMLFHEMSASVRSIVESTKKPEKASTFNFSFSENSGPQSKMQMGPGGHTHMFRLASMQGSLSREYFTLMGRTMRLPGGKRLLRDGDMLTSLSSIGSIPALDYLSRVVITALVFTDGGFLSKPLIKTWTSSSAFGGGSGKGDRSFKPTKAGRIRAASTLSQQTITGRGRGACSMGLKNYIYNLLGALSICNPLFFQQWGIDALVDMMEWETPGAVSQHLIKALLATVQSPEHMLMLVEKLGHRRVNPTTHPPLDLTMDQAYEPVLMYFLTVSPGIQYCRGGAGSSRDNSNATAPSMQEEGGTTGDTTSTDAIAADSWLVNALNRFKLPSTYSSDNNSTVSGAETYVHNYEVLLSKTLSRSYVRNALAPSSSLTPIPFLTKDLASTYSNASVCQPTQTPVGGQWTDYSAAATTRESIAASMFPTDSFFGNQGKNAGRARSSCLGSDSSDGDASNPHLSSASQDSDCVDIEGLLRLPWSVELKLTPKETTRAGGLRGQATSNNGSGPIISTGGDYIKVDTFLDSSDMATPHGTEICSDTNRFLKVRAVVLDPKGQPSGKAVPASKIVCCTLMAGVCPIDRHGKVISAVTADMRSGLYKDIGKQGGGGTTSFEQTRRLLMAACSQNSPTAPGGGKNKGNEVNPELEEPEVPPTYMLEGLYDWTTCLPFERPSPFSQKKGHVITELGTEGTLFSLECPGEPCKFIFSRKKPEEYYAHSTGIDSLPPHPEVIKEAANRRPSVLDKFKESGLLRRGSKARGRDSYVENAPTAVEEGTEEEVYLLEIQYYVRVYSGRSTFAALPVHLYGVLSRSGEGVKVMRQHGLLEELVQIVQESDSVLRASVDAELGYDETKTDYGSGSEGDSRVAAGCSAYTSSNARISRLKAAVWALAHICSTDMGFEAVQAAANSVQKKELAVFVSRVRASSNNSVPSSEAVDNNQVGLSLDGEEEVPLQREEGGGEALKLPLPPTGNDPENASSSGSNLPPAEGNPNQVQAQPQIAPHSPSREDFGTERASNEPQPMLAAFSIVEWCILAAREHPYYSVRGTVFSALGLISRSVQGKDLLAKYEWDSSAQGLSSAVTVPKDCSVIFHRNLRDEQAAAISSSACKSSSESARVKQPLCQAVPTKMAPVVAYLAPAAFLGVGGAKDPMHGLELEVLSLIARLNGSLSGETAHRLLHIKREQPTIFESRGLYVVAQQVLETCSFKLGDRRAIMNLFNFGVKK